VRTRSACVAYVKPETAETRPGAAPSQDRFEDSDKDPPPIRVIIAQGGEDVTIKVSDEGGGIPRSGLHRIWTYMYSTAESVLDTGTTRPGGPHAALDIILPCFLRRAPEHCEQTWAAAGRLQDVTEQLALSALWLWHTQTHRTATRSTRQQCWQGMDTGCR
jgi:hypothetical protein